DLPYAEIRDAIDSAFRDGGKSVIAELSVDGVTSSEPRYLKLTCYPLGEQKPTELVAVVIDDISELARDYHALELQLESTQAEHERDSRETSTRMLQVQADAASQIRRQQEQMDRLLR